MSSRATDNPLSTLRRAAMDHLARREHSFGELLRKLLASYPDCDRDAQVLPVLEQLRDENLQSDARFTEAFVRQRRARGYGPLRIQAELQQREVPAKLQRAELHGGDSDWRRLAREAVQRKHPQADLRQPRDYQRCYRFLVQRGFAAEDIAVALRSLQRGDEEEI